MSANANGTPTSLGIPTLNPAQDILKADGINEILTSIDSKIAGRLVAPAGALDKQVIKWSQSGGAYVASYVNPSELGQEGATDKQVLTWNQALGKWAPGASGAAAKIIPAATQAIANTTWTAVTFASAEFDTDTMWAVGNPTRLTCKTAGKFLINAQIAWPANASGGGRDVRIYKNGVPTSIHQDMQNPGGSVTHMLVSGMLDLAANDFIELWVWASAGPNTLLYNAAVGTSGAPTLDYSWLSAARVT